MGVLRMILAFLRAFLATRAALAAENMMLRQQLIVVQRSVARSKFRRMDRILLCWLSRFWPGWRSAMLIVQPETVVRWHRQGFKLYWRWKSRKKQGRPTISTEMRDLIQKLSSENPLWSAERIRDTLLLLRYDPPCEDTIRKYMVKPKGPHKKSTTWLPFLRNRLDISSMSPPIVAKILALARSRAATAAPSPIIFVPIAVTAGPERLELGLCGL